MPQEIIGQGLRFPLQLDARGRLATSEGVERVEDAIWIILKTSLGERVMRPTFGAGLDDYVFANNSPARRSEIVSAVKHALLTWEPRIDVEDVRVETVTHDPARPGRYEENHIFIAIDYRLRQTNEAFNAVFPLYTEEGVSDAAVA